MTARARTWKEIRAATHPSWVGLAYCPDPDCHMPVGYRHGPDCTRYPSIVTAAEAEAW